MKRSYWIYECPSCIMSFAVEQAFEEQDIIVCPSCGNDAIDEVGHGEMVETHNPSED